MKGYLCSEFCFENKNKKHDEKSKNTTEGFWKPVIVFINEEDAIKWKEEVCKKEFNNNEDMTKWLNTSIDNRKYEEIEIKGKVAVCELEVVEKYKNPDDHGNHHESRYWEIRHVFSADDDKNINNFLINEAYNTKSVSKEIGVE